MPSQMSRSITTLLTSFHMKTSTKLAYASILVSLITGTMNAKDLYISANGNDSNSGLAESAPRATLTGLNNIIEEGDIIHVSGMIDLTKEIPLTDGIEDKNSTWGHYISYSSGKQNGFYINGSNTQLNGKLTPWKEITIQGTNRDEDGFDGGEAMRLFYVRGDNNKTTVTFRNLTLRNGIAPGEGGGAIFIHDNGFVKVENCVFENHHLDYTVLKEETHSSGNIILKNPASERGGAILFQTGRLEISDSEFIGNKNRRGGAICQNGGVLTVKRTRFEGNGADVDGKYIDNTRGGAITLWPLNMEITANFDHCDFIGNTTWNSAGAVYAFSNTDGSNLLDAVFTNCSFIQNKTIDGQGGAAVISNSENMGAKDDKLKNIFLTFANSSFFFNEAKSEAGAIFFSGGIENDEFRMVNCTVAKNTTQGNAGHGAGYTEGIANNTFDPSNANRYFYNCIFEQNECPTASNGNGEYSDFLMYGYFNIDHSYFGRIMFTKITETDFSDMLTLTGTTPENVWHACLDGNFGNENHQFILSDDAINNYEYSGGKFTFIALNDNASELEKGNIKYLTLAPRTVSAANGKNFALQGYDISASDQMGFPRKKDVCALGAMEASVSNVEAYYDDIDFPYVDNGGQTGIESVIAADNTLSYANGIAYAQNAVISVYNISGTIVASGKESVDLGGLAAGIYIVKASGKGINSSIKVVR